MCLLNTLNPLHLGAQLWNGDVHDTSKHREFSNINKFFSK